MVLTKPTEPGELPVEERTRVRRLPERQSTDRALLHQILDSALVGHVAVVRDGWPVVLPFAIARDGDSLLLHGSTGAGVLRVLTGGAPVAVSATLVDGLVVARSGFDHSMNYRSAVVFGVPEVLEGEAKAAALEVLVDRLLPGRSAELRPSTRKELASTLLLRLPLDQASVKVRAGSPNAAADDGEDRTVWAGVLPVTTWAGEPVTDPDVPAGVDPPPSVRTAQQRLRRT